MEHRLHVGSAPFVQHSCVFKLYMYKLVLNEVQQDVIRGSIGLADGAGTPLKQGQDIPLTGAKRQAEVSV